MSDLFRPRYPLHTAPRPEETLHLEGILRSWHPRPRATLHPSGGNERVRFGDWTVSMEGIGIVVTTESPVASMAVAHDRVQEGRAIGDRYLLAMTANSGIPVHVDWEDAFIVRLSEQEHVEGDFWPTTLDFPEVEPPVPESFAALCRSDPLTDALILFREALAARAEGRPGVDLFLGLAVEHLVWQTSFRQWRSPPTRVRPGRRFRTHFRSTTSICGSCMRAFRSADTGMRVANGLGSTRRGRPR